MAHALGLEVGDTGLIGVAEGGALFGPSPAIAIVEAGRLRFGEEALAACRLLPRRVASDFWARLDGKPLGAQFPVELRAADLVHGHLETLWAKAGARTSEVLLAVSGGYDERQLGVLVGIAQALGIPVSGVVDSAVAAASAGFAGERVLHVELGQRRAVVSEIRQGASLVRERVAAIDRWGADEIVDAEVHGAAEVFVKQARFDPLHDATTEQALFDRLPGWLAALERADSLAVALPGAGRQVETVLTRGQAEAWTARFAEELQQQVSVLKHTGEPTSVIVSASASRLPGFVGRLREVRGVELALLGVHAAAAGALRARDQVRSAPGALRRVTRLARPEAPEASSFGAAVLLPPAARAAPVSSGRRPTHLLLENVAHPITAEPLVVGTAPPKGARRLQLGGETAGVSRSHCRVFESAGQAVVEDLSSWGTFVNGERVAGRAVLAAGDRVRVGSPGIELVLIASGGTSAVARRRETNIFSLSLLDCICCGFGALILFHMIVASRSGRIQRDNAEVLQAEVDKREQEVLEGQERLVEIRNSFRQIEEQRAQAQGLSTRILEALRQIQEELAIYEAQTVATRAHVNQLKADVKALEEGAKRLSGGVKSQEVPGRNLRSVAGDGDRQYLSGLKVGGKRIFLLVDASASMLAEDIVNAVRRRLFPPETRLRARKWRQAVKAVDWLAAQMPREAQYQIYVFNTRAAPVLPGTQGVWLEAKDAVTLDKAIATLRQTAPEGGTSLHHAFAAAKAMNPPPDNIILITDGLPTQGAAVPARKTVSGRDRLRHFDDALEQLPRAVPVNIVLFPMEGDPMAMSAFWKLAIASRGSLMTPSSAWP